MRHPATATWALPPARAHSDRVNLRELATRPGRFEHHLMVVARAGVAQLELVTASEPLFFAHANVSDEYALALPTGDALLDQFPLRTFLLDGTELVARMNHRVGQLVLHPHGLLHWPGMLRPPYEPPAFPGARRCGLSLVYCASEPTPPGERPLFVSAGVDVKAYAGAPPFMVADLGSEPSRCVARIGNSEMSLVVDPPSLEGPAYVVVLDAAPGSPSFACDLVHLRAGASLDTTGIRRALVVTAPHIDDPPVSWREVPASPMKPHPEIERLALPLDHEGLLVEEASPARVRITCQGASAEVPRYWLARMLFRIALHGYRLGYLETYEGFFYDDRDGYRLGVRGKGVALSNIEEAVSALYRAVAPPGYTEELKTED